MTSYKSNTSMLNHKIQSTLMIFYEKIHHHKPLVLRSQTKQLIPILQEPLLWSRGFEEYSFYKPLEGHKPTKVFDSLVSLFQAMCFRVWFCKKPSKKSQIFKKNCVTHVSLSRVEFGCTNYIILLNHKSLCVTHYGNSTPLSSHSNDIRFLSCRQQELL